MLSKILVLIAVGSVFLSGAQAMQEVSRKGAKAQREFKTTFAPLRFCARTDLQTTDLAVEVFQVLDLPLSVHEASLTKSERGYLLKLSLGNSSELKIVGLRYSLLTIDSANQPGPLVNRTEGFSVLPYATKNVTFKTPIRFKLRDGDRLVLMLEQVVSREWIWEVVKAKDAFEAYARGDYSAMPVVLRVANQVDAPPIAPRVIFEDK